MSTEYGSGNTYTNNISIIRCGELMAIINDDTTTYRFETPADDPNHMVLMLSDSSADECKDAIRCGAKIAVTIEW